jgi:hypothetical protein
MADFRGPVDLHSSPRYLSCLQLPMLIIGGLILLILCVAIIRAAASTRSQVREEVQVTHMRVASGECNAHRHASYALCSCILPAVCVQCGSQLASHDCFTE